MTQTGSITIRPGYLVVDSSTATGGVRYERTPEGEETINGGDGIQATHRTVKTVDHVQIVKELDAVVREADYLCRSVCTRTTFGWYADEEQLGRLRPLVAELEAKGHVLNARAKAAGSARRVHIGIVAARLEIASEEAAREIVRTIHNGLSGLREALRSGDRALVTAASRRARNLDRLATGIQGDAVRFALEGAETTRKSLFEQIKGGAAPERIGETLDLEALESALSYFPLPVDPSAPVSEGGEVACA